MTPKKIKKNIKQLLENLISFSSISGRNNHDLVNWIKSYATPFVDKITIFPQGDQGQESILLQMGAGKGGLVLSGHLDVVPVSGQPWQTDPFSLVELNGKYYGRGVADMKGFIACALALLPQLKALKKPLYLAFTCDEEIGCLAAPQMARLLLQNGAQKAFVWVGEPTSLQPVVGQKGITNLRTIIYGKAAHSSQIGQGISAIQIGAQLVLAVEKLMYQLKEKQQNLSFDIPFTSIHVGKICGGKAINIVPDHCFFDWEIRHLPEASIDEILQAFHHLCQSLEKEFLGLKVDTQALIDTVPALKDHQQQPWLSLLSKYLDQPNKKYVAYATEAGIFQQHGLQTLICGPGSISQAHQANEWIEIEQLQQCYNVMCAVLAEHCQATFKE